MDGASHMLKSALSEKRTSLTTRFQKFEEMDIDQESKSTQKEASKVLGQSEPVTTELGTVTT
jgi:hypothetical protein